MILLYLHPHTPPVPRSLADAISDLPSLYRPTSVFRPHHPRISSAPPLSYHPSVSLLLSSLYHFPSSPALSFPDIFLPWSCVLLCSLRSTSLASIRSNFISLMRSSLFHNQLFSLRSDTSRIYFLSTPHFSQFSFALRLRFGYARFPSALSDPLCPICSPFRLV